MCLFVYVDESGQPNQLDDGPYVLTSVIVSEEGVKNVVDQVRGFVEAVRGRYGINWLEEIHTKDLVEGSREWHGY